MVDSTASLWLVPWTTTLSAALTWWLIALAAGVITASDRYVPRRTALAMGGISGMAPFARPTDALTVAIVAAFCTVLLVRQRRLTRQMALAYLGSAAAALVAFASLYLAIYGPHLSLYMIAATEQGFAFGDLPWKVYTLVYTAQPWYPGAEALVERLPWLLPGTAGLITALAIKRGPARVVLTLLLCTGLPYGLLFLAYTDLQPPGLWTFGTAHYFVWLFPLFGAGLVLWWRALVERRTRLSAATATALCLAPACLRILPVPAADDQPARMLLFRGATSRDWAEAYFVPVRIVDARGTMANVNQFHQLPDPAGERAVAITRLFAANPRRFDPGDDPRFRGGRPYARYRERISIGVPCWLDRAACAPGADLATRADWR